MRVLFVAGEVAPFSETTETARLIRTLPEALQEVGGHEVRIIMPRYGDVSERRNRLHEVIRLSGAELHAGEATDTLHVKVASIPGIRLQVYFMDSAVFFKRKGLYRGRKDGVVFEDNPARALFFARAALSTARKLGWSPDVIHASGWIAALVPHLVQTEGATDPLFAPSKTVFSPDVVDAPLVVTAEHAETLGLPQGMVGKELRQIGIETADAVAYAPGDPGTAEPTADGLSDELVGPPEELVGRAVALYERITGPREMAA